MTSIEDLLREALGEISAPTATTDPLGAVDRRVRRARRRIAAGSLIAAVVVAAAVVVPLAATGSGRAGKVSVAVSPTPTASSADVMPLTGEGAMSVSATPDSAPFLLFDNSPGTAGTAYVGVVKPAGGIGARVDVPKPADTVYSDLDLAWVVGFDGAADRSRVTAAYPAPGVASTRDLPGEIVDAAVAADSLFVVRHATTGDVVERLVTGNGTVDVAWSAAVPGADGLAVSRNGIVWVHAGSQLVPFTPEAQAAQRGQPVPWGSGDVYGPATPDSPDAIWAYDGRLIDLSPALLQSGTSVAEGWRVFVPGTPDLVATAPDGGLYVVVNRPRSADAADAVGVFYYSARAVRDGNTPVTAQLDGAGVTSMALDPTGGVDVVRGGRLERWNPPAAR